VRKGNEWRRVDRSNDDSHGPLGKFLGKSAPDCSLTDSDWRRTSLQSAPFQGTRLGASPSSAKLNHAVPKTFPHLLLSHLAERPDAPALREKAYGIWQTLNWTQLTELVRQLAGGLAKAGVTRGDHVALIGENRPRLHASMVAIQVIGAVPVPLYHDAAATEIAFPLEHAGIMFAIGEGQEQVDKLLEIRHLVPQLSRIWYDEPRGLRGYSEDGLASIDSLAAEGTEFNASWPHFFNLELAKNQPDDVAAMFFTSGTTGNPKGVMHTHAALIDRAEAGAKFDRLTNKEEVLAYLPPAWIGQNIFSYAQWLVCGYVVNCPESASTIEIDMNDIGPTYYFAPPRVFEGLLTTVTIRMEDAGPFKRWLFRHFMGVARRVGPKLIGGRNTGAIDRLHYAVGNLLIYGPLRNTLGLSRVRVAYTAGEAIGPDLFTFYRSIGVNLKQMYGSTETAVFVCLQPDHEARIDTVGVPIDGVQIRLTEAGEILVKSPGLLKGYYRNPAATAEVLTAEGWYHTGDAGFLDAGGHLRIIDRAKDVGRMLGGVNDGAMFAPKYVENKLKFFPHIKEAVAIGDRRETVCAFINIDFEAVGNWAERRNLPYAGYSDLAQKPEVYELIRNCVERVNADLAADEKLAGSQISRFLILHKELDADDGELTRTRKVRRGFIADRYRVLVEALFSGRASQFIETDVKFEDGRTGSVAADLKIVDAKTFSLLKEAA
jgi:long-chain acyl-CoA synthetase